MGFRKYLKVQTGRAGKGIVKEIYNTKLARSLGAKWVAKGTKKAAKKVKEQSEYGKTVPQTAQEIKDELKRRELEQLKAETPGVLKRNIGTLPFIAFFIFAVVLDFFASIFPFVVAIPIHIMLFVLLLILLNDKKGPLIFVFIGELILALGPLAINAIFPIEIAAIVLTYFSSAIFPLWAIYIGLQYGLKSDSSIQKLLGLLPILYSVTIVVILIGTQSVIGFIGDAVDEIPDEAFEQQKNGINVITDYARTIFSPSTYGTQATKITTELQGIIIEDVKASQSNFFEGRPITIIKELTVLGEFGKDNYIVSLGCMIDGKEATVTPKTTTLSSTKRSQIIRCSDDGLSSGDKEVVISANYTHTSSFEIYPIFIKEETYTQYTERNEDPLEALNYPTREIEALIEQGPVEISLETGSAVPIPITNDPNSIYGPPPFLISLERNEYLQANSRITWEGIISNIMVTIEIPEGLTFENPTDCGNYDEDASKKNNYVFTADGTLEDSGDIISLTCFLELQNSNVFFGTDTIATRPIIGEISQNIRIIDRDEIEVRELKA